jgi:hypothetical protein
MTGEELRRLLIAPEIIVIDLTDAALAALRRALLVEHPTLGEFPSDEQSGVRRRAALVLHAAARLHAALEAYRRAVEPVLREPPTNDPF